MCTKHNARQIQKLANPGGWQGDSRAVDLDLDLHLVQMPKAYIKWGFTLYGGLKALSSLLHTIIGY